MYRAHWTADLLEAHIVANLLRAHDVAAHACDVDTIRQDWFKTLAFGGYRVLVPPAQAEQAAAIVRAYRSEALAFDDAEIERPPCPRCAGAGIGDPRPRRMTFAFLLAQNAALLLAGIAFETFMPLAIVLIGAQVVLVCPGIAAYLIKQRYRCPACGRRWRTPAHPFAELAHANANAERTRAQ